MTKKIDRLWDGKWPRWDPHRGYLLCEPCWNHQHFEPSYRDKDGIRRPKRSNCNRKGCSCGCVHDLAPRKAKFTGEGQTEILMDDPLQIGPRS